MSNPLFFRSVIFAISAAFFLSAYFLESIGFSYVAEGGSPVYKIHLYSYVTLLLFTLLVLKYGIKNIADKMDSFFKIWVISLACLAFVILYGLAKFGISGMAYLVDTFLAPLLILPIAIMLTLEQKKILLTYIAYLLFFNCLVAIGEYGLATRLVEVEFTKFSYFRSTAFLNHPLNNGLITIAIIPLILKRSRIPAVIYLAVSVLALFSFGGRAALGVYILALFFIALPGLYRFITVGFYMSKLRFSLLCLFSYFLIISFLIVVAESGIADRIISKLHMDESAFARVDVFYLLEQMSLNEWFWGATENLRSAIEIYLGISTIENYIIGWIFTFGLVGAIPLLVCLFSPLYFFFKNGEWLTKVSIISFFIAAISNNSLTTKTPILFFLYLTLLLLYSIKKTEKNGAT